MAGQSGAAGHIKISDGTLIYAKSGLMRSTKPKEKIFGFTGDNANSMYRMHALQRKLPELFKRFDKLEKCIESQK
jgi:UDP-3-O-[3-hydroxymyristoyl] glucosamine N-acyltransferase